MLIKVIIDEDGQIIREDNGKVVGNRFDLISYDFISNDNEFIKIEVDASIILLSSSDTVDKFSFAVLRSNAMIESYVAFNKALSYCVCNAIVSICPCK